MKIKAIYEEGRLLFSEPVYLKHPRVEVVVDVPDAEIERVGFDEATKRLVEELDRIRNAPIPPEWDEEPSSKLDRLDAFTLFRKD